jgi:AcrR family transcriptional regulator
MVDKDLTRLSTLGQEDSGIFIDQRSSRIRLVPKPAYKRLHVDERRSQLLRAGAILFTDHAYEQITMAQIAQVAGVSKPLLYHYFPSKIDLFKAAVVEHADELSQLLKTRSGDTPAEQLMHVLDAYLEWIERHERAWTKLIQSTTLPEARQLIDEFRSRTLVELAQGLTGDPEPKPALRTALHGWLGYIDAAILDWTEHHDLTRPQLRDLLLAAFGAAVLAAQQTDPSITLAPPAQPESPKPE